VSKFCCNIPPFDPPSSSYALLVASSLRTAAGESRKEPAGRRPLVNTRGARTCAGPPATPLRIACTSPPPDWPRPRTYDVLSSAALQSLSLATDPTSHRLGAVRLYAPPSPLRRRQQKVVSRLLSRLRRPPELLPGPPHPLPTCQQALGRDPGWATTTRSRLRISSGIRSPGRSTTPVLAAVRRKLAAALRPTGLLTPPPLLASLQSLARPLRDHEAHAP
jgi:hypothetical protein